MEQHPVPQNVTTFQFRLIGDMTIKQFGYLCAGAILAFIAYKLPLPFIITWPLTLVFAFLGVGFAFIPVEERPMDVWVFSFFKSIYNPTQYVWSREPQQEQAAAAHPPMTAPQQTPQTPTPVTPQPAPAPAAQASALSGLFQPTASPQHNITPPPPRHPSFMEELSSLFRPKRQTQHAPQAPSQPVPSVTGTHPAPLPQQTISEGPAAESMHQKITQLEETLKNLEEKLATKSMTEDRVLELQKQLTDVLTQKSKTEDELITLKRQQMNTSPTDVPAPATQQSSQSQPHGQQHAPSQVRSTVNVITTQEGAVKAGLPRLTNVPNVVTGLVKDDGNNLLPGILVTVTNHDGIPVRALKTNKLGQFAASTPLPTGVYFVEVEDPRNRFAFSRIQITLNNTVVPILEIIAKSQKALTREKLAQEIFGKPTV